MKEYIYLWIDRFVWINDQHHIFEKVGIPLSSRYHVDFDCKTLTVNDIEKSPSHGIDYFLIHPDAENGNYVVEEDAIVNDIVAIVGNNGCGKSCLLQLLKQILTKGASNCAKHSADFVLIYKDRDCEKGTEDKLYNIYCSNTDLNVTLKNGMENRGKSMEGKLYMENGKIDIEISKNNIGSDYKSDVVIFYSPFFSSGVNIGSLESGSDWGDSADISTMHVIDAYSDKLHLPGLKYRSQIDRLSSYSFYEQQIELEFVTAFLNKKYDLPMPLPEYMCIRNNDYPINWVINVLKEEIDDEKTKERVANIERLISILKEWKERKDFEVKIYLSVFTCLCKLEYMHINNLLSGVTEDTTMEKVIYSVAGITKDITIKKINSVVDSVTNGILQKLVCLIKAHSEKMDDGRQFFHIRDNGNVLGKIMDCHRDMVAHISQIPFLLFERQRLSTGEDNFIQLFARFYNIWKEYAKQNKYDSDPKDVVFLIDEGEANFHPEWQRKYIKLLIQWITLIMKEIKMDKTTKFQIILSTHSPFVVCDLPSRNLVRLRLDDTKKVKSVYVDNTSESQNIGIGAYITDLLKGDFFVESLLGELAEENIKALIRELRENGTLSTAKSEFVWNELGDTFLKNFLRGSK